MMPRLLSLCLTALLFHHATIARAAAEASPTSETGRVILDDTAVANLRLETATAEPGDFEETIFALGLIEAKPSHVAAVTSRISGRVIALAAHAGEKVNAGEELLRVESRQPGNPPPSVALTSPLSGWVTRAEVRLGDPVEPDRALLEITDLSEVFAVARVPEDAAGRIRPDATARIRMAALPDVALEGRLLRFGTAADPVGGTVEAVFVLPNAEGRLRPGMRAEFSIVIARRTEVLRVPRAAVQGDAMNPYVYVRDFELRNAFIKAPVVTGQRNDQYVEIVRGLFPADEVVTRGAYALSFAGAGTVSLKEALDAAHGHPHNADGSELQHGTEKAVSPAKRMEGEGAGEPQPAGGRRFWMAVSAVLLVLLVAMSLRRQKGGPSRPAKTSS